MDKELIDKAIKKVIKEYGPTLRMLGQCDKGELNMQIAKVEADFSSLVHHLLQGKIHNLDSKLLHAILGIGTEAGEVQDLIKKSMYYSKPFDKLTLKEELSDLLFYIQAAAECINSSLGEIMAINVAKLSTRYPNGYSHDKAIVRDKEAELKAMKNVEKQYE